MVEGEIGVNPVYTQDDALFYRTIYHEVTMGVDGILTVFASTEIYGEGVPELSELYSLRSGRLDWTSDPVYGPPSDPSKYVAEVGGERYDKSNPKDGYYRYTMNNSVYNTIGFMRDGVATPLFSLTMGLIWHDRFMSIDGQIIWFDEYRPSIQDTKFATTFEEVPATSTRGPSRVYTAEAKGEYLGKEIHMMIVDTVYVTMDTRPTEAIGVVAHTATDVSASKAVLSCTLPAGEEVAVEDVSFYVYNKGEFVGRYLATSKSEDGLYTALVTCFTPDATFEYKAVVYDDKYYGESDAIALTTPAKYTADDAVDLGLSVLWSAYHNVGAMNEGTLELR